MTESWSFSQTGDFRDQVAIVTGAGSGIGKAVAVGLARGRANVAIFDIDRAALSGTSEEIEAVGGKALTMMGDTASISDVESAVATALSTFGKLDLLACVAGIVRLGTVEECPERDWDLVMEVNVKGPYLFARAAIPAIRAAGGGAVVNVASVLAFATQKRVAAYAASKGAVVSLTSSLAIDYAEAGIRVNCVAPASVRTSLLLSNPRIRDAADPEAVLAEIGHGHPLGRLIEPDEVANVVLFLLSRRASAITGACYRVDGGLLSKLAQ